MGPKPAHLAFEVALLWDRQGGRLDRVRRAFLLPCFVLTLQGCAKTLQAVRDSEQGAEDRRVREQDVARTIAFGAIPDQVLNSLLPACTKGCGFDGSIGCLASTRTTFDRSSVTA